MARNIADYTEFVGEIKEAVRGSKGQKFYIKLEDRPGKPPRVQGDSGGSAYQYNITYSFGKYNEQAQPCQKEEASELEYLVEGAIMDTQSEINEWKKQQLNAINASLESEMFFTTKKENSHSRLIVYYQDSIAGEQLELFKEA